MSLVTFFYILRRYIDFLAFVSLPSASFIVTSQKERERGREREREREREFPLLQLFARETFPPVLSVFRKRTFVGSGAKRPSQYLFWCEAFPAREISNIFRFSSYIVLSFVFLLLSNNG